MRYSATYAVVLVLATGALLVPSRVSAQEANTREKTQSVAPLRSALSADVSRVADASQFTDAARLLAPLRDQVPEEEWNRIRTGLQRLLDKAPSAAVRRSEAVRAARYLYQNFVAPEHRDSVGTSEPPVTQVGPVHTVPFGSQGNRIALSITDKAAGPVRVSVNEAHQGLKLNARSVTLSRREVAEGRRAEFSFAVKRTVAVEDTAVVKFAVTSAEGDVVARKHVRVKVATPEEVALRGNYPNPFRRQTTIGYTLPEDARVRIEIYDVLGRKVGELVGERQDAGYREVQWQTHAHASGLYLYRLIVDAEGGGRSVKQGKMTLVR